MFVRKFVSLVLFVCVCIMKQRDEIISWSQQAFVYVMHLELVHEKHDRIFFNNNNDNFIVSVLLHDMNYFIMCVLNVKYE